MSQIFDALQRSETDRSGTEVSAVKELLEVVERNSAQPVGGNELAKANTAVVQSREYPTAPVVVSSQNKLVCVTDGESLAAEKFRFLAVRLRHLQQKRAMKRILVTSSVPGEGKTMIVENLACALAGNKQKVLLLEGDLRRPSVSPQLGLDGLPGLAELLESNGSGNHSFNVYRLESLGFWMLPAGRPPRNPMECLQPAKLSALMDELAGDFDWIVIDSPPVLPLADTSIWMRLADAILLVTRPGMTAKKQLQRSLETIESAKLLGAVLNGSKEATANNYYNYHYSHSAGQTGSQTAK
jgi:capsular exopolysaccharide synthesis family protein